MVYSQVGESITFQLLKRSKGCILPEAVASSIQLATPIALGAPSASIIIGGSANSSLSRDGLIGNIFAKFALASGDEATSLWRDSAAELAAYAAQVGCVESDIMQDPLSRVTGDPLNPSQPVKVTSEGGTEAAYLAPFIFASLEALSSRARK